MNYLSEIHLAISIPIAIIIATILAYKGSSGIIWATLILGLICGFSTTLLVPIIVALILAILIIPPLRTALISKAIMKLLAKMGLLPTISQTEKEAILNQGPCGEGVSKCGQNKAE